MTTNSQRTVLVTCAAQNAALACARSLHAAGWRVILADHDERAKGLASKAAAKKLILAHSPTQNPQAYAAEILGYVREYKVDVLVPTTDAAIFALLPVRDDLEQFVAVPWPSSDSLRAAADKEATFALAAELGFALPRTWNIENAQKLPIDLIYPVVIKPRRSLVDGRKVAVAYAADEETLQRIVADLPAGALPALVQQRIVGPGEGYFAVWRRGEPMVECAHRRLREMPPSGGVSTLREAIELPADMCELARKLLTRWQWHGPVMVEFKRGADGLAYLMEVNGRLWGSLQLAVDAGIDIPLASALTALGEEVPPMKYRPGVRTRWELGDVDATLTRLLKSESALDLPPGAPSSLNWLLNFFLDFFRPSVRLEVFRWRDMGPFMTEKIAWLRNKWGMVRKRLRHGRSITALLHVHSSVSYDGELSVAEIAKVMRKNEIQVCLLSEHDINLTQEKLDRLVVDCHKENADDLLIVPGVEFTLPDGQHLIGYGVTKLLDVADPALLCAEIRAAGGIAVLAHPKKGIFEEHPKLAAALDGYEVWNTGHDGPYVPGPQRLREFVSGRDAVPRLNAFQGVDFHRFGQQRGVRTWLPAQATDWPAIRVALRAGDYRFGNGFVKCGPRGTSGWRIIGYEMLKKVVSQMRKIKTKLKAPFLVPCWEYMDCRDVNCKARFKNEGGLICWRTVGDFVPEPERGEGCSGPCVDCDFYRKRNNLSRRHRILHLIETGNPGGAERMMLGLISGLNREHFGSRVVLLKEGWLSRKVGEAGVPLTFYKLGRRDWRFALNLARLVRRCDIDLLHSHEFTMNVYAFLAARLSCRPNLATIHGNLSYLLAHFRRRFAYRLVAQFGGPMVVVSNEMKEQVAQRFKIPAKFLRVIFNGVPVPEKTGDKEERINIRRSMNLPEDAYLIAVIGSLYRVKGQSVLIEAMPAIVAKHPHVHLAVIGRGDMREELERKVTELHLQNHVTFTGYRDDAREALPGFDLVVVPSRYEGLSLLVVEAMAARRPIVATHVGGNPEAIVDGESGILVPPEDPHALVQACLRVIDDPVLAASLGEKAQRRVQQSFTRENMVENYEKVYRELIGEKR